MSTKDEFIIYLQDEIAWLRAELKIEKPERIRVETEFKQSRAYKSAYSKVREQVLFNKRKNESSVIDEKKYEQITVDE